MPKSRHFQPGDSAPDFSHLADDGPGAEDDAWPVADEPGVKSQVTPDVTPDVDPVGAPTDDGPLPARPGSGLTPGLSGRSADPSGESHIFFETELPLNAEQMLGDTLALDSASAPRPNGPLDVASVLDAAPDADKQERGLEAQTDSQLTDIGIPCFDPPPAVAESASQEDDRQNGPHEQAHAGHPGLEPATARAGAAAAAPVDKAAAQDDVNVSAAPLSSPAPTASVSPAAPARQRSRTAPAAPGGGGDRGRLIMILLASYASAVTIAALWLWLNSSAARPHELESLPDVAPLEPNEFRYAPQNASMPQGHTLPLGAAQQLGYIKVEPLRVTRGPVRFSHYSDQTQSKPPTAPVLKLWLRFTNVSSDQSIAPLDRDLLLTRSYQHEQDSVLANQLVLPADKASRKPGYVIDHPLTSEWDLAGQKLGHRLKPGESVETYIPLEPGSADHLAGDLLWRVHFRKGYHDATGHGVTTMIEVPFSITDVQPESATPT